MTQRRFIHIPKTGGMSIRHARLPGVVVSGKGMHVSDDYTSRVAGHMLRNNEHHGFEHARWRDGRADLRRLPSFAAVRNPWARVASRYFFGLQVARMEKPESKNYSSTQTFDEFLEERFRWGEEPYYWHRGVRGWYPQLDYVTDEDGKLKCDILRTEHLREDVREYLGLELPPRRRNVTAISTPYREMYTPKQIQIVADWYAKDIEVFGFDFAHAATRNCFK